MSLFSVEVLDINEFSTMGTSGAAPFIGRMTPARSARSRGNSPEPSGIGTPLPPQARTKRLCKDQPTWRTHLGVCLVKDDRGDVMSDIKRFHDVRRAPLSRRTMLKGAAAAG